MHLSTVIIRLAWTQFRASFLLSLCLCSSGRQILWISGQIVTRYHSSWQLTRWGSFRSDLLSIAIVYSALGSVAGSRRVVTAEISSLSDARFFSRSRTFQALGWWCCWDAQDFRPRKRGHQIRARWLHLNMMVDLRSSGFSRPTQAVTKRKRQNTSRMLVELDLWTKNELLNSCTYGWENSLRGQRSLHMLSASPKIYIWFSWIESVRLIKKFRLTKLCYEIQEFEDTDLLYNFVKSDTN